MKNAKRNGPPTTYQGLMARDPRGGRRIEHLSWTYLARLWTASRPNSPVRRATIAEARRLGYTPRVVLGLHA